MTWSRFGLALIGSAALATIPAQAHPIAGRASALEASVTLKGKICRTKPGATFAFEPSGRYAYDGLWQSAGTYEMGDHSVIVTFDSGLRRAFAVSLKNGILYLEGTAVTCSSE